MPQIRYNRQCVCYNFFVYHYLAKFHLAFLPVVNCICSCVESIVQPCQLCLGALTSLTVFWSHVDGWKLLLQQYETGRFGIVICLWKRPCMPLRIWSEHGENCLSALVNSRLDYVILHGISAADISRIQHVRNKTNRTLSSYSPQSALAANQLPYFIQGNTCI